MPFQEGQRELRIRDAGQQARDMQARLAQLGYMDREDVTGKFNFNTKESLKLYQFNHGLRQTGTCDEETWDDLMENSKCLT